MKILISSHAFAPSIGGIETVTALLAAEFLRLDHEVAVVTQTAAENPEPLPYRVVRQPSLGELSSLLGWCDIFWQNNLSLRTLWPALLRRTPVVITHQGSYCRKPNGVDVVQRLKRATVERLPSVAISRAVAECFAMDSRIIPNPFDARLFSAGPATTERRGDLIFVGRLVSEKGVDVLLSAMPKISARLTIVGAGPEQPALEELTSRLGLRERVVFAGAWRGADLAELLHAHNILVVPSRYEEPFGVVALEGIASGCVVVGSSGGGLPEAIGPCGRTFPNGDADALARSLEQLCSAPDERAQLLAQAPVHLAQFHPIVIAQAYLDVFHSLRS